MGHIDENSRDGSDHPRVNGSQTQLHLFYLGAIRFDPLPDLRGGASPGRDRTGPLAGRVPIIFFFGSWHLAVDMVTSSLHFAVMVTPAAPAAAVLSEEQSRTN